MDRREESNMRYTVGLVVGYIFCAHKNKYLTESELTTDRDLTAN